MDLSKVDRIEIVDADGRQFVGYFDATGATLELQDDGQTLKVFVDGTRRDEPSPEHRAALAADMAAIDQDRDALFADVRRRHGLS